MPEHADWENALIGSGGGQLTLVSAVLCLSSALDMVAPVVANHHLRVCHAAGSLAVEMGLSQRSVEDVCLACLLHDIGVLSLRERLDTLDFDSNDKHHAEFGYRLLRQWKTLEKPALLVRAHHDAYCDKREGLGGHIIHLADRIDVLLDRSRFVLDQVPDVTQRILAGAGTEFHPDVVEAFRALTGRDSFWLDMHSPSIRAIVEKETPQSRFLSMDGSNMEAVVEFGKLVARVIDYRSHFTATHSSGVAASAEALSLAFDFSPQRTSLMRVAGYLHDLGKLATPNEILEKPGPLTKSEMRIVRAHPYHTLGLLGGVPQLGDLSRWAAFHHERPSGGGYPFNLDRGKLSREARIMAVADVFTAITEDRPYRAGMERARAMSVLGKMADSGALCAECVDLLRQKFDQVNQVRTMEQQQARQVYGVVAD